VRLGLGREKATVEVELDREEVAAGEMLEATVHVAGGARDLAIDEGRVRLVYENEYEWSETTTTHALGSSSSSGSSSTTRTRRTATDRQVIDDQAFLGPGVVEADAALDVTLAIQIPATAIPSAEGSITRVRWKLEATLARPHARDVSAEAAVRILSTPDQSDWSAAPDTVDSHDDCELAFRLDRNAYDAGTVIEGYLVASPLRDCKVSEIRVELERVEHVDRPGDNEKRARAAAVVVAAGVELAAHEPHEYPLQLDVPLDAIPSLRTTKTTVRWFLKGVGARTLRRDYRVVKELLVCGAPMSHQLEHGRGSQKH
jgi:hypothetical protein